MDRNTSFLPASLFGLPSLSARRAWIEIKSSIEEVSKYVSLSARRAWIEIIDYVVEYVNDASRSPQGERG